jgi:hypothetical protein
MQSLVAVSVDPDADFFNAIGTFPKQCFGQFMGRKRTFTAGFEGATLIRCGRLEVQPAQESM